MEKWGKEELTDRIIKACIRVHAELGPGYSENIYHTALKIELPLQELSFESEKEVRIYYSGKDIGIHKLDLLIAGDIVVELKAVDELHKKHYAQVRSYLKAVNRHIGLLVNFANYKLDVRRIELEVKK
ncbi:MAG: GxxExxY protein [Nitrospirota bacterium]